MSLLADKTGDQVNSQRPFHAASWPADMRSRSPDRRRQRPSRRLLKLARLAERTDEIAGSRLFSSAERHRRCADLLKNDRDETFSRSKSAIVSGILPPSALTRRMMN